MRRSSASERAWYFCGSWVQVVLPSRVSKRLSPRPMAAALATDQGRNSAPTSSFRSGIRVDASAGQVSNDPSFFGASMRCTQAITSGAAARMIAPGIGSVAAS